MNKLVYLFELDSVRTTQEEIKHGQEVLFDEIVKNGNFIACTFNQIVDSPAFLAILNDEKKYQDMLQLINFGVIRVSRYDDIRTPSQYAQNALDKCICDTNNFIFSSLPITASETDLLKTMNQALKNTDLSILIDEIKASKGNKKREEKLTVLMRFVKLVLTFSMDGLTINKPKEEKKLLQYFISEVLKMEPVSLKETDSIHQFLLDYKNDFISSQNTLKQIMESLVKNKMDQKNRSNWFKLIDEMSIDDNAKRMPKAIIDLCYNYAVEDSIFGVAKHYQDFENSEVSFKADFFKRLEGYISSKHDFSKSDKDKHINYEGKLPDWDVAVRLRNQGEEPDNKSSYYEDSFIEEQSKWTKSIWRKVGFRFLSIFIGICLFLFAEIVMDWIKNIWSILQSFDDKTFHQSLNTIYGSFNLKIIPQSINGFLQSLDFSKIGTTIMNVIIFGLISAQVSKKYKIPDLLDSFKGIWINIFDAWRIWKNKENDAYHRL